MRVRFWGVRGSVPYATADSIGHGCNTACVEVVDEATDRLLILDAGTGIVGLGDTLAPGAREVPILLSHYHWDHIQGLPYFTPVYRAGEAITLWAPALGGGQAELQRVFAEPYHPVPYDELPSRPSIQAIGPGESVINGFDVRVQRLNHPGGALGYRVQGTGGDLVYVTDHEFGDPAIDEPLGACVAGAAALILDAHFTPEELPHHKGWGHADWREAATFAKRCRDGRLFLTHHRAGRTDGELDRITAHAQRIFPETRAAREGETFVV
jgi:phosphoribosyl 1,2-cyclic phosphodiesterase